MNLSAFIHQSTTFLNTLECLPTHAEEGCNSGFTYKGYPVLSIFHNSNVYNNFWCRYCAFRQTGSLEQKHTEAFLPVYHDGGGNSYVYSLLNSLKAKETKSGRELWYSPDRCYHLMALLRDSEGRAARGAVTVVWPELRTGGWRQAAVASPYKAGSATTGPSPLSPRLRHGDASLVSTWRSTTQIATDCLPPSPTTLRDSTFKTNTQKTSVHAESAKWANLDSAIAFAGLRNFFAYLHRS